MATKNVIFIAVIVVAVGTVAGIFFAINNKLDNELRAANTKLDVIATNVNKQTDEISRQQQMITELQQSVSPQVMQAASCGNGKCDADENLLNCSKDCFKSYCLPACQEQNFQGFTYDCSSKNVGEKFEAPDHAGTCCCTNVNAISE